MYRLYYLLFFIPLSTGLLSGQCVDQEAHNTSIVSNWISCEASSNPLTTLPNSHWILYEFEEVLSIASMKLWNINNPDYLTMGSQDIRIDISRDGALWETHDTISIDMAPGHPDYIGQKIEGLEGIETKYVLMTVLSNYGAECSGFAEVKFNLGQLSTTTEDLLVNALKTWPNPADQKITISLESLNGKVKGYQISDMLGRTISRKDFTPSDALDQIEIKTNHLSDGQYIISVISDEGRYNESIVVVHPN